MLKNVLLPLHSTDEKRAAQLKEQLLAMSQNVPTPTGSGGGIFCQLEAQFRAHQMLASRTHIRYTHPLLLAMRVARTNECSGSVQFLPQNSNFRVRDA